MMLCHLSTKGCAAGTSLDCNAGQSQRCTIITNRRFTCAKGQQIQRCLTKPEHVQALIHLFKRHSVIKRKNVAITNTGFLNYMINSFITATVGGGPQTTGGNIQINSPYIVLKDSHVIANAYEGKGGNISITADTYLADWTSTVSTSSALGISGQVDINSPLVNLSGLLSPLPTALVDISELLVSDCETRYKRRKASSLVVKGRDALPAQPGDLWPSPVMMQ